MSEKLSQHSVETPIEQTKQAVQEETKGMLDSLKDMFKKSWESVKDALKDVLSVFGRDTALGKLFGDIFGIEVNNETTEDEYLKKIEDVIGKRVQELQETDVEKLLENKSLLPFLNPTFRREMTFLPNTTYQTYIEKISENAPKEFMEQLGRLPMGDILPPSVTHVTVEGVLYNRSGTMYVTTRGEKLEITALKSFTVNETSVVEEVSQSLDSFGEKYREALLLIKKFEVGGNGTLKAQHLSAYPDPGTRGKPYTVGYGSTRKKDGSPFKLREKVTVAEAEELLIHQVKTEFLPGVQKIPGWNEMTMEMQNALLSFAYNIGAHFYGSSGATGLTMLLKNRDWDKVPSKLMEYTKGGRRKIGGLRERREIGGLRERREKEANLWKEGLQKLKSRKT